ncbi:helix-turn-helix domain-containing protein [Paenibacillus sp. BC26]|uniref:helix-turn-helix domain-containing protein n=1 Tax=Paenibacillus sp. BC26 TaxID=1881032 RepID=UPI0008E165C1|nr:helix-turn-helix domain-containing protein [Paenibacillus sp. BC26]SFS74382.1 transcriptional regulator, AraC family [Paenibacillus sp. BC26]
MSETTLYNLKYGIDIYENKHPEGNLINEHHHQFHQMLYVLDGSGTILLSGKSYALKRDCGVLITPYTNHSIISDSKLTVLVLAFNQDMLDSAITYELLQQFFKHSRFIAPLPFGRRELQQLLRKMIFEQTQGNAFNYLAMKIYLSEILLIVARQESSYQVTDANDVRAEKLRNYIDNHYFEISDSNDLSSKLGLGVRHMNNIFKERYKITPVHYLAEVRIELSKKMLVETEKEISSICFEVGFENLSTFYRTFKNHTWVSPNIYRRIHTDHGIE